jgi:DNA-binding NarL/FixJ family response regulator
MEKATAAAFGVFGREGALSIVSGVLADGGSAVAVGDPGVGKSSLLKVADQLAQRRGRRVLFVAPTQFERGLPFAGLAELISQCPDGADHALPDPQRRALAVAVQRAEPGDAEVDGLAVPLAVRSMLTHLCATEPVAIIIDDLQWLDQATVGSLAFALRRTSAEPQRLSVLVGTRPEGTGSDLIRCLVEPRHELSLPPLEDWAIGQLLRRRLGPRWTPPMSAGVARVSGGNPFLALMVATAMQAEASKVGASAPPGHDHVFPVPPSLAELLHERAARLPQDARDVLLLVAAAGRLGVTQLHRIVDEPRVRSALEAAADADVAVVGAGSVVTFTHPLLSSAIYDAAPPADRRRAHRILAENLEDTVERARHRSKTITAPDETVAVELERAAETSLGRGAPQLGGELLERAALATPTEVDAAAGFGRWLRAVEAYVQAGDGVAANAALNKGSALAVMPEQKAQVLARRIRLADQGSGMRTIAEQALRLAPTGSDIRAELLTWLGSIHRMEGNGTEALRCMRMAVTEAAAAKRFDVQLIALNERLAIEQHWGKGRPKQTLRDIEQLVNGSAQELPGVQMAWTYGFFAAWNDENAETHVRNAIKSAIDAGRYDGLSDLYICLVLVLIRSSRVRDAQAALDESDRVGAWTTSSFQEDMARTLVAEYAGELDVAREVAQSAVERARDAESAYWLAGFLAQVGFIETSARNWQAALDALRELAQIFARTEMVDLEQLLWGVDYADAALQVGAMEDVEMAIAVLRRQGASGRPEATVAADRSEAMLIAVRGDVDGALHTLVNVVEQRASECPFEAARSLLALGRVYRRGGYKRMASDALSRAAATFEELGTPRWAVRARDEAARTGLFPSRSELTTTERRVAEHVASGHSNQETAAALFMSVKTVEANLSRIYRKLSVRSRTELANHVNKLDPTPHLD